MISGQCHFDFLKLPRALTAFGALQPFELKQVTAGGPIGWPWAPNQTGANPGSGRLKVAARWGAIVTQLHQHQYFFKRHCFHPCFPLFITNNLIMESAPVKIAIIILRHHQIPSCLVGEIALNYYNVPRVLHVS